MPKVQKRRQNGKRSRVNSRGSLWPPGNERTVPSGCAAVRRSRGGFRRYGALTGVDGSGSGSGVSSSTRTSGRTPTSGRCPNDRYVLLMSKGNEARRDTAEPLSREEHRVQHPCVTDGVRAMLWGLDGGCPPVSKERGRCPNCVNQRRSLGHPDQTARRGQREDWIGADTAKAASTEPR